jgi:hypothetical protein
MKVIDAENPLDLSQEPSEQSEVSSCHPDEARYDLREELFVGKCDAGLENADLTHVPWIESDGHLFAYIRRKSEREIPQALKVNAITAHFAGPDFLHQ